MSAEDTLSNVAMGLNNSTIQPYKYSARCETIIFIYTAVLCVKFGIEKKNHYPFLRCIVNILTLQEQ